MKVLAEYVMAGPRQAAIASLALGFLPILGPWISSAAIALVVLQVGIEKGTKILPWALVPGVFWFYLGDPGFLMLLLTVYSAALVLHVQRSLSLALLVACCSSALLFVAVVTFLPKALDPLVTMMTQVVSSSEEFREAISAAQTDEDIDKEVLVADINERELVEKNPVSLEQNPDGKLEVTIRKLAYLAFAWASALSACLVLLIGRWWQSLLYKPGAFQEEFHGLRLSLNLAFVISLAMFLLMQVSEFGYALAAMFSIPILLTGIALIHSLVKIAGMSVHWLGMFYLGLILMGHFLYLPLLIIALLDTAFDFRNRLKVSKK